MSINLDEFFDHFRRSEELLMAHFQSFLELPDTLEKAYQNYTEQHGREPLTQKEKRQVFMDAILEDRPVPPEQL